MKIGYGRDIHSFAAEGRDLRLGGVNIPCSLKVKAHSDGDVLLHAFAEALLGALAKGDLGTFFPENDDSIDNIDSSLILKKALSLMEEEGYYIENVDISVVLEKPKLRPYICSIRESLKEITGLSLDCISVKAQTNEGLGEVGANKAIECFCAVLINKITDNK